MIVAFDRPDTDIDAPESISPDELAAMVQPTVCIVNKAPRSSDRNRRRKRLRLLQRALTKKPARVLAARAAKTH
jgi:hypothetical protein